MLMPKNTLNKILLIDDEIDLCKIVQVSLEKIGHFKVVYYNSGPDALLHIDDFKPDLILLDMMMPDMDGIAILKALRNTIAYANTPIVFFTAKMHTHDISRYRRLGVV